MAQIYPHPRSHFTEASPPSYATVQVAFCCGAYACHTFKDFNLYNSGFTLMTVENKDLGAAKAMLNHTGGAPASRDPKYFNHEYIFLPLGETHTLIIKRNTYGDS